MESRSHNRHRRVRTPLLFFSQSLSILSDGVESAIKIIVVCRGSVPGVDPPRSQPEAGPLLLKKYQLEKNNASQLKPTASNDGWIV